MAYKAVETAIIEEGAVIGDDTRIWHYTQVRSGAQIGRGVTIGKNCYIDSGVIIGDYCKIQNNVNIYNGVTLENGVFVGPNTTFTNDYLPRAVNPDMTPKSEQDWEVYTTVVRNGASIGANATIICNVEIGEWALVAAGAVVTKDVGSYNLVVGCPACRHGYVCKCGIMRSPNFRSLSYCSICGEK